MTHASTCAEAWRWRRRARGNLHRCRSRSRQTSPPSFAQAVQRHRAVRAHNRGREGGTA
jgi:hypothetical protein